MVATGSAEWCYKSNENVQGVTIGMGAANHIELNANVLQNITVLIIFV